MTCNVFSGTLNPTQSINQSYWCGFQDAKEEVDESWQDGGGGDEEEEMFTCPYPGCGRTFRYKKGSVFHQRTKHGGVYGGDKLVAYFCRIKNCGRTFYSRSSLAQHQKYLHGLVAVSDQNFA